MADESSPPQGWRSRYQLVYLRAWRHAAQLTTLALAKRAGLTENVVVDAERQKRKPYLASAEKLAAAIGIPTDVLISYSPCDAEVSEHLIQLAYRATLERLAQLDPDVCSPADKGA